MNGKQIRWYMKLVHTYKLNAKKIYPKDFDILQALHDSDMYCIEPDPKMEPRYIELLRRASL